MEREENEISLTEGLKMPFWELDLFNGLTLWALDLVNSFGAVPSFIVPYTCNKRFLITSFDELSCNIDSLGKINWTNFSLWGDFQRSLELKQINLLSLLLEKLRNLTLPFFKFLSAASKLLLFSRSGFNSALSSNEYCHWETKVKSCTMLLTFLWWS